MNWNSLKPQRQKLLQARRFGEARELELEYLGLHPDDAAAQAAAAWTAGALQDLDAAISHVRRAITLEPDNLSLHISLAATLERATIEAKTKVDLLAKSVMEKARASQRSIVESALAAAVPNWRFGAECHRALHFADVFQRFASDAAPHWFSSCPQVLNTGEIADLSPIGKFRVGDTNQIIHKRLSRMIPWELPIAALVMELAYRCDETAAMLDIGANIGTITVPMAKSHLGPVIAIEPDKSNFFDLENNIELNDLRNVTALQVAVSDKPGRASLHRPQNNPTNPHIESSDVGEVDVTTLDAIVQERVAVIKMDIEGHEANAIRGARSILVRDKPIVLCEILGNDRSALNELTQLGYIAHHLAASDWMFYPGSI